MTINRIAVRGIIWLDGKLFLQRNAHADGNTNDFWSLPGGKLEHGESLTKGLARELLEECGVNAEIGRLLFVQQFISELGENLEFFFVIDNPEDFKKSDWQASEMAFEIAEAGWFEPGSIDEIKPNFLRNITDDYIKNGQAGYINLLDTDVHQNIA